MCVCGWGGVYARSKCLCCFPQHGSFLRLITGMVLGGIFGSLLGTFMLLRLLRNIFLQEELGTKAGRGSSWPAWLSALQPWVVSGQSLLAVCS